MRWMIDSQLETEAVWGVVYAREFVAQFDQSRVDWFKIDRGESKRGRGVWGMCYHPCKHRSLYRIACHVNLSDQYLPHRIGVRRPPIYVEALQAIEDPDTARLVALDRLTNGARLGDLCVNADRTKAWFRVLDHTTVHSRDEAVVWIVGHESWHWLRRSQQVPGRNDEIQADAFGDWLATCYRLGTDVCVAATIAMEGHWMEGLR